jgi:hypothetical protein
LVQPGLHRTEADTEFGGDLAVAEPLQVEQQHSLTLAWREVGDGASDSLRQHGGLGHLLRPGRWISEVNADQRADPASLLEQPSRHVQGDATQPRAEASRLGEPVQAHERNHDCLLAGVTGQVGVVEDPLGQTAGRVPMAYDESGEGVLVTEPGTCRQLGVGDDGGRVGSGHTP